MTALVAPADRLAQRLTSLDRANEVRLARTALRYQIARGETLCADVLLSPPPEAMSWAICDLLVAQRRWGTIRARRLCQRNQIGENKAVGALTERQRRLLARQVGLAAR